MKKSKPHYILWKYSWDDPELFFAIAGYLKTCCVVIKLSHVFLNSKEKINFKIMCILRISLSSFPTAKSTVKSLKPEALEKNVYLLIFIWKIEKAREGGMEGRGKTEREERERSHLLIYSSIACNSQGRQGRARSQELHPVSHMCGRKPNTWIIVCYFPGCTGVGMLDWKQRWDLIPGTQIP